ncbi:MULTISPECIES: hypothetical protein [Rhizobium]|uniref:Uncharacterized protein n=1 Tax=Rhizobium leguminosarum TaxID=384 RepID=A0A6P0C2Y0_RHILE|nr:MULTISPECIES: hypothetical protein [Rhizobium]MBY3179984.1 hypothetical protein [Rhizobium leguminosarum]MBY3349155.1 hypothetical protein [Rhizobium laguerreae]MBY3356206.1 hypothetical protein [Rhizobium laguerreae]MBY3370207.1 hypothetical protein [Rhizobium laguerreae]MBY3377283.1 hypothetical protein [Rhizobium laguerreae]
MTNVILTWFDEPTTAFRFGLDRSIPLRDVGVIQKDILPLFRSTPGLNFVFAGAKFEIEDRSAILAVVDALERAGHTVENKGDIPPEIEAPAPKF